MIDNEADKNDYDTCPYCGIIGVLEGHRCKPRADKDTPVERLIILRDATKGIDCVMSPMDREAIGQAIIKIESLTAQNEEYDRALELLSSGWAYVHDMHGFAKTQRKRISELQGEDSE